ncbi:hypothetical protein SynMITS9220_02645 [Synechococcus sp. MIT S9220]|nr:hypothetical protein SynMITS9220_02645 [Synechococcus sp. MIT S9220]
MRAVMASNQSDQQSSRRPRRLHSPTLSSGSSSGTNPSKHLRVKQRLTKAECPVLELLSNQVAAA